MAGELIFGAVAPCPIPPTYLRAATVYLFTSVQTICVNVRMAIAYTVYTALFASCVKHQVNDTCLWGPLKIISLPDITSATASCFKIVHYLHTAIKLLLLLLLLSSYPDCIFFLNIRLNCQNSFNTIHCQYNLMLVLSQGYVKTYFTWTKIQHYNAKTIKYVNLNRNNMVTLKSNMVYSPGYTSGML